MFLNWIVVKYKKYYELHKENINNIRCIVGYILSAVYVYALISGIVCDALCTVQFI